MIKSNYINKLLEELISLNERNILNTKEIDIRLEILSRAIPSNRSDIKKWLQKVLRLYLINDYEGVRLYKQSRTPPSEWIIQALQRGEEIYVVDIDPIEDQIKTVIKYLLESPDAPSKNGLFALKVPKAIEEAERWFETVREGVEVIKKYSDGYHWVELTTKETVEREGKLMSNCLKDDPEFYARGGVYSLRDVQERPHITFITSIGYIDRELGDIKGKGNKPISSK
jgi:hypothetical protein